MLVNESALILLMIASALIMQVLMASALAGMMGMLREMVKVLQSISMQLAVIDTRQQQGQNPND